MEQIASVGIVFRLAITGHHKKVNVVDYNCIVRRKISCCLEH